MKKAIVLTLILLSISQQASSTVFCPDDRYEMPMDSKLPWGAVGYMNNACTATLIDSEHILAAAHCFSYLNWIGKDQLGNDLYEDGFWQVRNDGQGVPQLGFYPGYNPNWDVSTNPSIIPMLQEHKIDRAVVGVRLGAGGSAAAYWGIGHLTTPVTDWPSLEIKTVPLYPYDIQLPGYGRDQNYFDENGIPAPHPIPNWIVDPDPQSGNCWWTPALVDSDCSVDTDDTNYPGVLTHDCATVGGNSGSPLIWSKPSFIRLRHTRYYIAGVNHGGGENVEACDPLPPDKNGLSLGPSAEWFQYAPRFSAGVALARYDDGTSRTQVFSTDSDTNRVVRRYRDGLESNDSFTPFSVLDTITDPQIIEAFNQPNGKPQLIVVTKNGYLLSKRVANDNNWSAWTRMSRPSIMILSNKQMVSPGRVIDIASSYDANAMPRIYVATERGTVYTRTQSNRSFLRRWTSWKSLLNAHQKFVKITALTRVDGVQQLFLVNQDGAVFTQWETDQETNTWSNPEPFPNLDALPKIVDIAVTIDLLQSINVFALDENGKIWVRISAADEWSEWALWSVGLYNPGTSGHSTTDFYQSGPFQLASLTAGHLREEDRLPVLFATDKYGNIYYTTQQSTPGTIIKFWNGWRSFYDAL